MFKTTTELDGLAAYQHAMAAHNEKRILETADILFREKGFSRAKMINIAYRADVSTATLYKYFRSKEELFAACIEKISEPDKKNKGASADFLRDVMIGGLHAIRIPASRKVAITLLKQDGLLPAD
ncbi:MAG: TetR/AcrR family transcriptional regulator [Robiginitomaculum sp.]|nr:TetR/AcrR family transcriptional regulator [Robiginitomaculum sp.]MBN4051736.1 TetR/AcrR family transcriptional regulator [Parvibaculum lavamentivorans]